MSTLSIYDVVADLVWETDTEIERRIEAALDAETPYKAGVAFQYVHGLYQRLSQLVKAQDENIDAVFSAVTNLNAFIECPF